jgi:histidine triad (HIT) family protein
MIQVGGSGMSDCLFCKIAAGEIPAKIVFEDERVVAFEDIQPQAPIHILIIPRKHIPTLLDLDEEDQELLGYMHLVANHIAGEKSLAESGFRLVTNCKESAGQLVFHIHIHLLGGREFGWPPG